MDFELLFSPLKINQLFLENRVAMAPTHDYLADEDGFATQETTDFYLRRAGGGGSLLILGATFVSPKRFRRHHRCLYHDKFIPPLKHLTDKIHSHTSAKVFIQLVDILSSAPDRLPDVNRASGEEIAEIVEDFERGALRARESGFDGIEIHAAHGYALAMFLSLRNKRDDEYGGALENRLRLVAEVYQRVRSAVGGEYPIGIRINGDEFIIDANTLSHSRVIARRLAEMGMDYISVSAGGKYEDIPGLAPLLGRLFPYPPSGGYSGFRTIPPAYMPEGVNVYLAEDIRAVLRKAGYLTPVMTAGRIPHPKFAEAILKEGKADFIGLCRPLLRDPYWALKVREGREKEIARCEYCNVCAERMSRQEPVYCKHEK